MTHTFDFEESPVRTLLRDNEPWFVARDVCDVLGIKNSRDAVGRLDEDEKGVALTDTPGGSQNVAIINEPGIYTLVLRCDDAIKIGTRAYRFRKWVTVDVLPALRREEAARLRCTLPLPLAMMAIGPEIEHTATQGQLLLAAAIIAAMIFLAGLCLGLAIEGWRRDRKHPHRAFRWQIARELHGDAQIIGDIDPPAHWTRKPGPCPAFGEHDWKRMLNGTGCICGAMKTEDEEP